MGKTENMVFSGGKKYLGGSRRPRRTKASLKPSTKREIGKMIDRKVASKTEFKVKDVTIPYTSVQPVGATPIIQSLSGILQGTSANTRNGVDINPKVLNLRYHIKGQADFNHPNVSQYIYQLQVEYRVRVIVIQYLADDTATPAGAGTPNFADILEATSNPDSFYNYEETSKWRKLYDATHYMGADPANSNYTEYQRISIPARKMRKIKYIGNTSRGYNNLYIMAFSDYNAADSKYPLIEITSRLRYSDQ